MTLRSLTCMLMMLCLLAVAFCPAKAADVYVRASADGDGTSKDAPMGELWKAIDRSLRGDVIHVAAGVYTGKGGCGHFTIKTPDLTLVGGYSEDFSERNPFKHHTLLQRAEDYRGDWTGLPTAIIAGDEHADHSGLTVDGFVLNATTRNGYAEDKILPKKSYNGDCFKVRSKNVKLRNSILLNPYGEGIYCTWQGEENEVSNCFILNTFREGISTRSAQDESVILLKNNTIAFCWFQPGKGGGIGVFIGNRGKTVLKDNVIAYIQTEGDGEGNAVSNTFGNDYTEMVGNVFFQCQGGYYKYMDLDKKNLLVWKSEGLADLNDDPEMYMLWEAEGNTNEDPSLQPEKDYFEKFLNTVASKPGKLNMDLMNEWRRSVGLPLQAEAGTARQNWGMAYPLEAIVPNLVSKLPGKGVQPEGPFAEYASAAAVAEDVEYVEMEFDAFKRDVPAVKSLAGQPVVFKGLLGQTDSSYLLEAAPRSDYVCYKVPKVGENPDATRTFVYGYMLKGSQAHKDWEKYSRRRERYNKDGLVIRGRAYYVGSDSYSYPVGIIIDEVSRK